MGRALTAEVGLPYDGLALIADPIHQYITFTVPQGSPEEATEKDLIDSAWVQRLRCIYQLQSARWVYPSAEHSRFQHSLGAMHVAGLFARQLYPSLRRVVSGDCPSEPCVEEFLRVSALLHDVGHGPFCHFFDHNFLDAYGLTHEDLSQRIILEKLAPVIRRLRRSPRGRFRPGERLDPRHIAFLIKKGGGRPSAAVPRWVALLKPILDGIYTADNLDYVLRDSYMCGVAIGPVDLERLLHYTFFTPNGLTLHRAGTSALTMFLTARLYLYTNVYYHRTTRAIDLHLKELFKPTMRILFPYHPRDLNRYLQLTDWTLLETVRRWPESRDRARRALGREWERVLLREVKWKLAYEKTLPIREVEPGRTVLNEAEWEQKIRGLLPPRLRRIEFQADIAWQDPRPENPLQMGRRQIYVFNPATGTSAKEPLQELFEYMPSKIILCRVYGAGHDHDRELARAAEAALHSRDGGSKTNI